jgi:hypothetical protein
MLKGLIPIDEKLRMLLPVLGHRKVGRLRQMYLFEDDSRAKREIESHIDLLIARHVKTTVDDSVILPPPSASICPGDIDIGTVEYLDRPLCPFGLKLKDINRHVGVFGSTGSGKTTFALNLIRKLHAQGLPFVIFDWETSYRDLAAEFDDVQVITVGKDINPLHLNILDVPPGITSEEYTKSLIALLSEDFLSGAGSDTMFMQYMKMAYDECDKPSFADLKEIVIREIQREMKGGKLRGRAGLWKETVQRIIAFLASGAAGTVLDTHKQYPLDQLFRKNIVLEFGGVQSPRDRKFLIHTIVNWLFLWMQAHGTETEHLNQCLIFEEFHNITLKSREDNLISLLFRQCRKYGIGLIAIDQTPSEIPNAIFANMNVKATFTLATNQDITAMSKAMNMGPYDARFLGMLDTGQAIINVRQRYNDPFVIRVPFVQPPPKMWDSDLGMAMKQFADCTEDITLTMDQPGLVQTVQGTDTSPTMQPETLDPLSKIVLQSIADRPLDSVRDRIKRLGLHPSQISDIHETLVKAGIIREVSVDRKKLFELTTEGRIVADEAGINVQKHPSRGGIAHTYWVDQISGFLKKLRFQPVLEHRDIDIVDPAAGVAIEIETGKSDMHKNITKLKDSRFSKLFMLATSRTVELKLKDLAASHPSICVLYVGDFLKLTPEAIVGC